MDRTVYDWHPPSVRNPLGRYRDPISGAIALQALLGSSALFTAEAGVLALGTIGAIGSFAASTALTIGLSYAAQALLTKGASSRTAVNSEQSRYSTRQTVPPKRYVYGQAYVGGALFFEKVVPPYLYHGYLIAEGPIEGIDAIFIGSNELSFPSGMTPNTILTPGGVVGQPAYNDRLKVSVRLGEDDQAVDPLLLDGFPDIGSEFRQPGIATIVLRYDFGADQDEFISLWGNNPYPNAFFLIKGRKIYVHGKPGHDKNDSSTWEYNNIAANVQADYLRADFGGRISTNRINWDKVKEAADYDAGLIGTLSGEYLPRHTIDGLVSLDQSPSDVLSGMLSANRGFVLQAGGLTWPSSSKPLDPVLTIYDSLLVGGIQYQAGKPKRELRNSIKSRFIAKEQSYSLIDGPTLTRDDYVTADGELLEGTLSLPFTIDYRRVERLQKAYLDSSRLGRTITVSVSLLALGQATDEIIGSPIRIDSLLFPQANGIYQVTNVSFADNFASINITAAEYEKDIETNFIPSVDETAFTFPEVDLS